MISISLVGYRLIMSRKMNMNYDQENWELLGKDWSMKFCAPGACKQTAEDQG